MYSYEIFMKVALKLYKFQRSLKGFAVKFQRTSMVISANFHVIKIMNLLSLSTLVLNSRDWSEIVWLPAGMHWLGYNDAVSSLTKRKLEYFSLQPILKISKSACISSACLPASLPASLP